MTHKALWLAPLAASLLPAPALAQGQGNYHVRNNTRMTLDCGLRRERGSLMERFTLRPGGEWRSAEGGNRPRLLLCDTGSVPPRFQLQPGARNALVEGARGGLVLAPIMN
jgi:hypothetical protein